MRERAFGLYEYSKSCTMISFAPKKITWKKMSRRPGTEKKEIRDIVGSQVGR